MKSKRSIYIGIILVIIINLFGTINVSANTTEIPDYSIWKTDFLMAQLTDTIAVDIATRDVYDAVAKESYYYRDIYNQCIDSTLYNLVQVETAQWCVDEVDFVTNPEYFYDVVLIDILQNNAIETVDSGDYQADISSAVYTITKEISSDIATNWMDDVDYKNLLNYKIASEEVKIEAANAFKEQLSKHSKYRTFLETDLDFIDSLCQVGKSYSDALSETLTLLETANYSQQQVDILKKMYSLSDNEHLRTSLSKQIATYEEFTNPTYIYNHVDFGKDVAQITVRNLFMFAITKGSESILSSIHVLGNTTMAPIVATWEVGTALADLLFNTEDSATAYLTIKATVEIEDILQATMQDLRNQFNQDKSLYNAELCLEAYKMTLANAYNGTNVAQEFGYAITKSGLVLNLIYGDKHYDDFVSIGNSCREIIKIRYYDYPKLILKCYGLIFYHTDDLSVLSSISSEDINDGSDSIYNGINAWNLGSNYTIKSGEMFIVDSLNLSGGTLTLEKDGILVIRDGVTHTKGTFNVGKGKVYVGGNYSQSGGLLNVGGGFIQIGANYRAENNFQDGDCNLVMQDENGYMLVNGDFYVAIDRDSNGLLTAGTLELKGDFTQRGDRRGWSYYTDTRTVYGFCPTDKHRVIFSGDTQQNISRQTWQTYNGAEQLNYPVCSYFNIVKSTNPNVVFTKDFFVKNIEEGSIFKTLRIKSVNLSNTEFQVNGTLYATDTAVVDSTITTQTLNISLGTTTLENSELQVIGNADHKGGNLTVKTGKLLVNGNYNHTGGELVAGKGYTEIKGDYTATGSCNLVMQDELGYVLIYGDYYVEKDNDSTGYLTAGTLELKGNFSQYGGKRGIGYLGNPASAYGFCGSDKHIVILSGEEKQTIYTQSTGLFGSLYHYPACSYFNILKIKNTSADGVDFTSTVYVLDDIEQPTGTSISNKASVYLNNKSAFVDYGELNPTINAYVFNAADVIPTYMDYEEYMATQILSIELENIKMEQNKITGNLLFDNQKTDFENILYIIAAYTDDELINCEITPISIKHKETENINFSLDIEEKATYVKAFVWTDLEAMMPLCESVSITIQ